MNFLTQLAVLIVVFVILVILIKSNQTLEKIFFEEEEKERKRETFDDPEPEKEVERSGGTIPMSIQTKPSGWSVEILDDYGRCKEKRRIPGFPFTIGRNEDNDLVLDDLSVSGHHVSLAEENGMIKMTDQGSLNKIYAFGSLVTAVTLNDKMEIGLGNVRLRFLKEQEEKNTTICYAKNNYMEEWL